MASNKLCAYCVQVPLDIEVLQEHREGSWKLGTVGRIRRSNCPLCRIVSFALYEDSRAAGYVISSSTEMVIVWDDRDSKLGNKFWLISPGGRVSICFVDNSATNYLEGKALCLTPNLGQTLDLGRVKQWLFECTTNHGGDCSAIFENDSGRHIPQNYAGLELLRLIDVQKECIVETRVVCRYITLSYVWGSTINFRLSTSNLSDVMKPYSLKEIKLPQTIKDAIEFVRGIGEQYLWCDALCLLQNDPEDLSQGVNAMDLIYERALLTIVAASGHDANFGLPGVREGTRYMPRYPEEIIPGVQLDVHVELDAAMKYSLYNTRAWTLQEDILSRRAVYFVQNRVYFRCRSTTLYEFYHPRLDSCKQRPEGSVASLLPEAVHMIYPVVDYMTILLYYSERSLSHQQDALRALAGIIRRLSERMKCKFLEGLPTATFDLFILFRGNGSYLQRRKGFPSYSWVGWIGPLYIVDTSVETFLEHCTWIVWYKRSVTGTTNLVWDPLANESFPYHDDDYIGYRRRHSFKCPTALSFPTTRTQPTFDLNLESTARNYSILQFWTLSVNFKIKMTRMIDHSALLLDSFGSTCGVLFPDDLGNTTFFNSAENYELIAISTATGSHWRGSITAGRLLLDANINDEDELYNVLVLEWSGGVAERRGIGAIHQRSVTNSILLGPVWKEILLA